MLLKVTIGLFLLSSFITCSKDNTAKPYGFVNLRVDGQDEDIKWETVTSDWMAGSGNLDIEATSYYFERCAVHLKNIQLGNVTPVALSQFYYTDGIDFQPFAIFG